jgi:hypothetical protein
MKSQVGTVCFSKFPFSYKTKNWKSYLCLSHIQLTSHTKFTKQAMHELLLLLYFLFPHMSFIKEKILMGTHSSMGARERVMGFFFFFFSLLFFSDLTQFMHFDNSGVLFLSRLPLFFGCKFDCLHSSGICLTSWPNF